MCYTYREKPWIFNPATRQRITLPAAPQSCIKDYCYFGHDPVNNQYKVICSKGVRNIFTQEIWSEHWVFVLKPGGGSWNKVPDFCPHIPLEQGLCIDGVIYYVARIGIGKYVIVSFHIRSEEFKTIQVPRKDGDLLLERFEDLRLIDYGGKLSLLDQTNLKDQGMLDLWVLEDATNKEWWRKSLVLQSSQLHLVKNTTFYGRCTTQHGKLLLIPKYFLSPFHFLCYDLQSNDMRKMEIKGIPDHWLDKDKANVGFDLMFMDQSESVTHLET